MADELKILAGQNDATDTTIQRALQAARTHLGMEVAYVSEFVDDMSVFREVDAPGKEALVKAGDAIPLSDVYCRHILAGRLPERIPDTALEPLAVSLPITQAAPIGCHMSVPIVLADGRPYGMFCCLSSEPDASLTERDLNVMRAFADVAAHQIDREQAERAAAAQRESRIQQVIEERSFRQVFQPIHDLNDDAVAGFECLTRFDSEPYRSPDVWFGEAAEAGLGVDLELATLAAALAHSAQLRERVYVSLNASPQAILHANALCLLDDIEPGQVVLEVTEHARVSDYPELLRRLAPYRRAGLRLAVDDAGAGYASLQHIVRLQPDIIKLDMSLTRGVDKDPALRALTTALVRFARETGSEIIAEGIETDSELVTLKALGIAKGQGYLLGKPAPIDDALRRLPEKLVA